MQHKRRAMLPAVQEKIAWVRATSTRWRAPCPQVNQSSNNATATNAPVSVAMAIHDTLAGGDLSSYFAASYNMLPFPDHDLRYTVYTIYTLSTHNRQMSKEKVINFRIDAHLKKQAKKLAEADGRSLSNWLTRLIEREVERAAKN
ncbi:MAG: hypothetical protein KDJ27_06670 [Gammaproteobacteria bacterium]|nr:hypothetical protein [Gammaproteobacteria bacterium]